MAVLYWSADGSGAANRPVRNMTRSQYRSGQSDSHPNSAANQASIAALQDTLRRVPADFVMTCFKSLGREVTAWADQEHPRTIEMCGRVGQTGGGSGRVWCLEGAVETLINQTADAQDGIRFCRAVQGAEMKRVCYRLVGEFVAMLVTGTQARGQRCESAEPEYVLTCRRGAGIEPSGRDEE